ncbi:MAG TPA: thioredoxin family protein [Ignavibacteriaceae bacterium]|nr:thioredoxin family protein [Ignavibacteriaceae bacterium]
MKTLLKTNFIFFIFLLFNYTPAQNYPTWYNNLEDGIDAAKAEGKKVLLLFTGSDWCGWCQKLSAEVFRQKEFAEFADYHLACVAIDFPKWKYQSDEEKEYNKKLARNFGVTGYPTVFLLDKSGKILGRTGYQAGGAEAYIEHIKSFLR